MKFNKWTIGLAAVGVVSFASAAKAEESHGNALMTAVSSTMISGYVDTAIHFNPGPLSTAAYSFGGHGVGGVPFATPLSKDDGFNLNVVDLKIEKPLDESEWAAGYKVELWLGPDANALANSSLGVNAQDFGVRNAYVTLRTPIGNGIDWKIGVWDTIIGYETQNAPENPNYTRSWGHTIEPTQHTGILGSYRVSDVLSLSAGIANAINGSANARVSDTQQTYMASFALTAPESMGFLKGGTLYAGVVDGRVSNSLIGGPNTPPDRTFFYVGGTLPTPVEGLTAGFAWDHVYIRNIAGRSTRDTDAFAAYGSFRVSDKLTVNGRFDYLSLGGDGSGGLGNDLITGGAAFAPGDEFLTTTLTLDYKLWANVVSRLEYRWDHDLNKNGGNHFAAGGPGTGQNNEHLFALNIAYKF